MENKGKKDKANDDERGTEVEKEHGRKVRGSEGKREERGGEI